MQIDYTNQALSVGNAQTVTSKQVSNKTTLCHITCHVIRTRHIVIKRVCSISSLLVHCHSFINNCSLFVVDIEFES